MLRLRLDPDLLLFDPKIERSLRRSRQARRRAELDNTLHSQVARLASDNNHFHWSDFDSDSDTQSILFDTGTFAMGERLTLKQIGSASSALDNQPNRYPKWNAIFELICATTRRTGGDKDAVKAFTLPFSLDDRANDWYHTLPADVTSDWSKFNKRLLEKYFPSSKTNAITLSRISCLSITSVRR
ncbi:hypothetical protein PIB30_084508 [Stylosanthes scabra]|uniref:Retrotransposon gag domain-containing protein n=1 Tax=Stylosanthes scabra TaxID=79078 RepID=A0ABU6UUB7_9FABA|nr:hypothetical protein [Stylosanthes scabra]